MKKKILIFILNIFLLFIFGCKSNEKEVKKNIEQEFFTVMPKKNYTLDPHSYKDDYSRTLIIQLWEGITELKDDGVRLVSANKIEHSKDFKTWKIELRNDLKWSDGLKIDAQTYLDSWISALKDENKSDEIYRLFVIDNARKISRNEINPDKLGVSAEGNKLTIKLNTPIDNFDKWLANPIFYPIRKENKNLNYDKLIVNGAFFINSFSENLIILEKNEKYWDSINTKLKKVNIQLVEDKIMAYEMFPRMEIDFFGYPFYRIPFERRKQLSSLPESITFPVNRYLYLNILSKDKFFSTKKVRKILYSATDPEFMGKFIIFNNSPTIYKHTERNSEFLEKTKNEFLELKNKMNIEFPEGGYIAYSQPNKTLEKKLLLSTLKEWISLFKMPIRVTSSSEVKPSFALESYLLGTDNLRDFYYYLNYKYQNSDSNLLIKTDIEFLENLPVIPLNRIYESVLVHSKVEGLYLEPNGDLHLKYINIRF